MPETSFNNRLAQRPKGKQDRFIIESFDSGVFVSQARYLFIAGMGEDEMKQKDMLIKNLKQSSLGIAGIFLLFVALPALAEDWSQRYIESLPDSAFAAIEITKDGKKIRHLPHHNHVGEMENSIN
ncbi:MAG: hypothetical protein HY752_05145 [Nitrospirae bacterium]|nr:hypothetical protein [Nitrospirota bacterium]